MKIEVVPLKDADFRQFKDDMQKAFQFGAELELGKKVGEILPEKHIECSLSMPGAAAYEALYDGELVGGAIVVIDEKTQHNRLDFLYVENGFQGEGIGLQIWEFLEARYPETVVWKTITPYFEKRNIHFYINRCGFHAVEFFNEHHPDLNDRDEFSDLEWEKGVGNSAYFDGAFLFEKVTAR